MQFPPNLLPRPRTEFNHLDGRTRQIGRILSLASPVGTSFQDCTPVVKPGRVLVITRIHGAVTGRDNTTTLTDEIVFRLTDGTNNMDLPITVPGLAGSEPVRFVLDLPFGDCFALGANPGTLASPGAGMKLQVKVTNSGIYFVPMIEGYWLSREEARQSGIEPLVLASATTFAGNAFVGATHQTDLGINAIVQPKTGLSPQIEFLAIHGYAADGATAQTGKLWFQDSNSNNFPLAKWHNKSASLAGFENMVASGMEINGGYGDKIVYQNSKLNTYSVWVIGRYVAKHGTADPHGGNAGGSIVGAGKKFWAYFEEATAAADKIHQVFAFNGAGTNVLTPSGVTVNNFAQVAHVRGALLSINKNTGTSIGGIAVCQTNVVTTAVYPSLGVATGTATTHTGTQNLLVSRLDLPLPIADASANVFVNMKVADGAANFAGLVWGRLRPSSEVALAGTGGTAPAGVTMTVPNVLSNIYKSIA